MSYPSQPPRTANAYPVRRDLSPTPTHNLTNARRDPSPSRPKRQTNFENGSETSKPLLETDTVNTAGPPLAGPETDNDSDDRETVNRQPGVDDGFFPNSRPRDPNAENIPNTSGPERPVNTPDPDSDRFPANNPRSLPGGGRDPDFPYAPGYGPDVTFRVPDYAPTEWGGGSETIPDVNMYQHKKTLAQGMMDLALFSANANQLRYVLESFDRHPYYYASVTLIALSLFIQVAVGIGLIWNAHYNVKDKKEICIANKISNMTIIGIFIVTVVNVFISAFGVANSPVSVTIGTRAGEIEETTVLEGM